MSRKSARGPLPKQRPTAAAPTPRALDEISVENEKLCSHAGKLQYQIYVLEKDLEQTNQSIMNCNYEAAARQKLDAEATKGEA